MLRKFLFLLIFSCFLVGSQGCTMLEYLAPHQLWKLNRQPPLGRDDAYFSIPPEYQLPATSHIKNTE